MATGRVGGELTRFVHASFVAPVPRDHRQSDRAFRRRRWVAGATLVVGATLLGLSLSLEPGDVLFYWSTFALAAVWTLGAFLSGPLHLGWARTRAAGLVRPLLQPLCVGLVAVAVFSAGAVLVAQVPPLRHAVDDVLDYARFASLPVVVVITLVNGLAEELFFRGALYAASPRHPVATTTVVYALVTVTTGNLMLVFAAVVLGLIVGLERRVTGGVLGPMITHVTWSLSMLFVLPPLIEALS